VIDILPTILEATGLPRPERVYGVTQAPIEGVSMAYTWDDAKAASRRTSQYFEMFANRALYQDGWVAATTPTTPPWVGTAEKIDPIDGYTWELYNVAEDFSQSKDVAASNPDKPANCSEPSTSRPSNTRSCPSTTPRWSVST
jgi:arylsulfatase